ncbi:MAG: ChaN family lipoprotein [Microcoleaceae cyanobacterium]
MKSFALLRFCSFSLGFIFCFPLVSWANPTTDVIESVIVQSTTQTEILQQLENANVIYLGETHNDEADHQAQLEIIQALYQKNPKIAIAFEMFQRPYQTILDQYIAGKITEEQLIEQSEYNQRWGFPWEYYAEIVRFGQQHQLPLLALNTPTEITRKVAKEGLKSLTDEEKQYIPPFEEIKTDDTEYRQMLEEIYKQYHHGGLGNSQAFENFFLAQVLWDETMAEKVAEFVSENPDYQVIVLVGEGHIVYDYGIPSRVERRLNTNSLNYHSILFQSSDEEPISLSDNIADFVWKHGE